MREFNCGGFDAKTTVFISGDSVESVCLLMCSNELLEKVIVLGRLLIFIVIWMVV